MEYQLGDVIKEKRIEHGYTQQQLADLSGYTRTLISKIEQSNRKPSEELLLELSYLLSFDFVSLHKNLAKYKSFNHYTLYHELSQAVEERNISKITNLLNNKIIKEEFTYGDTYVLREYCKSIVYLEVNNDIKKAHKKCLKILNIDDDSICTHRIKLNQPNYYYASYLILEYTLVQQGNLETERTLIENILQFLEKNYFNSVLPLSAIDYFLKKFYVVNLNNLADINFNLENYEAALFYCQKGIEKCTEFSILHLLYQMMMLKSEVLYMSGKKEEATLYYNQLSSFCQLTDSAGFLDLRAERLKQSYPEFFSTL